jgi:hypothetical protein
MMIFDVYYIAIKAAFFFGLVHSFVKFENLQRHWLFVALLYTAGVALLSWIWIIAPGRQPFETWRNWLIVTGVLAIVYFKLLERFDEGILFWMLLLAGIGLVWY